MGRTKLTTAPGLVHGVIESVDGKRNGSIVSLQQSMENTSQWLDEAITSAKRKIVAGSGVPIQEIKKAKTTTFSSPIRDKENSPNNNVVNSDSNNEASKAPKIKPPPSAVKRKVNGMRVVDLRKELKSKGIETKGLKKDLQQRLLQAYTTVENIMSPPKQQQQQQQSQEHNPSENLALFSTKEGDESDYKKSDNIVDSESVEIIVFEDDKGKSESKAHNDDEAKNSDKPTEKSAENDTLAAPAKEEKQPDFNITGPTAKTGRDDVEMVDPTDLHASAVNNSSNNDAMEVEVVEQRISLDTNQYGSDKSITDGGITKAKEATSASSKTDLKRQAVERDGSDPMTPTEDAPAPSSLSEAQNQASKKPAFNNQEKQQRQQATKEKSASSSSRKVTQESMHSKANMESNESNSSINSKSSNESQRIVYQLPQKPATDQQEEKANSSVQPEKQQSPIRRVQAAIHKFTANATSTVKSPVRSKPKTTPSKLAWLTNKKAEPFQQQQKQEEQEIDFTDQSTKSSATLRQIPEDVSNVKDPVPKELPSERATASKATRRPGMRLASNTGTSSASASKTSRVLAGSSSSALSSSSAKATNQARFDRLAQIRGMSKPVPKSSAFANKTMSANASAMKHNANDTVVDEKEAKRKHLVAQMREKAAGARMQQNAMTLNKPTASAPNDTNTYGKKEIASIPNKVAQAKRAEVELKKPVAQKPVVNGQLKSPPPQQVPEAAAAPGQPPLSSSKARASSSSSSSFKKSTTPNNRSHDQDDLAALRPQLLSPMDTYEISDREDCGSDSESESESESEDENNTRKKIPEWALRANLIPALDRQFAQGSDRSDPDEIFCEVQTCDLGAIFSSKRSRYIRRTSSGNWTNDKVTVHEKLTYKRDMGYIEKKK